jgi:glutamate-1-semialdehyde 2,1-aminomutase
MEMVRAVNSGTEAVMTAIRLARGVTRRDMIVKFDGCYHGHSDAVLVKSGSGVLTMGASSSAGVTAGSVADTIVVPYNSLESVELAFAAHPGKIAAVIVEPVAGNMGLVMPNDGFLKGLREITSRNGALLIADEVINSFRFAFSSYSSAFAGIEPDIITLGKIIGGGLPLAAVGGKAEWMKHLAPEGPVYQAGTLSGNPLAVAAGLTVLDELEKSPPYARMAKLGEMLATGVNQIAKKNSLPLQCLFFKGVFTVFCTDGEISDLASAKKCDTRLYSKIFHGMLSRGIYTAPSQFECNFISAAHSQEDIQNFISAFEETVSELDS